MKIIAVIPARYDSSRLPGKPLKDICGKPMIWWVYQQALKVQIFDEIYVATDNDLIKNCCDSYNMKVLMTSPNHDTHISRIHEVSTIIDADAYVCICGDEPLMEAKIIKRIIPKSIGKDELYVSALMREFDEPAEVIDPGNIKIMTNEDDYCVALSRSPIPFPYKTVLFKYKKIVGVECYNKKSLDFFVNTPKGACEKIEEVTLMRFLENHIKMKFIKVNSVALSVDTEKDLEKVRLIMSEKIKRKAGKKP